MPAASVNDTAVIDAGGAGRTRLDEELTPQGCARGVSGVNRS
jgi:hypothetical protein